VERESLLVVSACRVRFVWKGRST